jgi:hypothetical protein
MVVVNKEDTEPWFLTGKVEVITSKVLRPVLWLGYLLWNFCVIDDHKCFIVKKNMLPDFMFKKIIEKQRER